ncbi:unnamed protein product [Coccothraustes coccothraustes]
MRQAGQPRWPGRAQVRAARTPRAPGLLRCPRAAGRRAERAPARGLGAGSGRGGAGGTNSVWAEVRRGQMSCVPASPVRSRTRGAAARAPLARAAPSIAGHASGAPGAAMALPPALHEGRFGSRDVPVLLAPARSSLPPSVSGGTCGKCRAWNGAFAAVRADQEGQSAVPGLSPGVAGAPSACGLVGYRTSRWH